MQNEPWSELITAREKRSRLLEELDRLNEGHVPCPPPPWWQILRSRHRWTTENAPTSLDQYKTAHSGNTEYCVDCGEVDLFIYSY